jgi:hypothetical protein
MTFKRLEDLAKQRYQHGHYADHRLHMGRELSGMLMQRYQLPEAEQEIDRLRNSVFGTPLLHQLMGIPIVIDVAMLEGPMQWILVDATGEEVERGEVLDADATEEASSVAASE